jgi:hypothetical protein
MSVSRGRPSAEGGGTSGSITSHSPSVVSLSYRMPARLYCGRVILVQTIVLSLESIQSEESQLAEITQFLFQSNTNEAPPLQQCLLHRLRRRASSAPIALASRRSRQWPLEPKGRTNDRDGVPACSEALAYFL